MEGRDKGLILKSVILNDPMHQNNWFADKTCRQKKHLKPECDHNHITKIWIWETAQTSSYSTNRNIDTLKSSSTFAENLQSHWVSLLRKFKT